MVRFARAEGSKGSNKRVPEEPTPWHELAPTKAPEGKADIQKTLKNVEKDKNKERGNNGIAKKDVTKKKKRVLDESGADTLQIKKKKCVGKNDTVDKENEEINSNQTTGKVDLIEVKQTKKKIKKKTENGVKKDEVKGKKKRKLDKANGEENTDTVQIKKKKNSADESGTEGKVVNVELEKDDDCIEKSSDVKQKRKKKTKKMDNGKVEEKKEFVINDKSQRVKVFKDGTERTWFDLPYEEGQRMTRYDNMWVKKEVVEKLDQLKGSLKGEGHSEKEVMRMMMKAKRKAHRELRIELIYEQKAAVEDQLPESKSKVVKKKNKIPNEGGNSIKKYSDNDDDNYEHNFEVSSGDNKVSCFRCHQPGHRIADCPQTGTENVTTEKESQITCFKCHQPGHRIADCPTAAGIEDTKAGNVGQITCFNCNEPGHRKIDCPKMSECNRTGSDNQITCFKCHQPGHRIADCPTAAGIEDTKTGNDGQITCFNCNEPGHRKIDCPKMTGREFNRTGSDNQITCFNCHQPGHRRADCPGGMGRSDCGSAWNENKLTCFKCNQPGHKMSDCPAAGGEYGRSGPNNQITCFNCHQPGHRRADCPGGMGGNYYGSASYSGSHPGSGGMGSDFGLGRNGNQATCFRCHQPGHKISDCPEAGGGNQITCFKCHQPGHRISDCPEAGGDNQITCFNCHQPGHRRADCPGGMGRNDYGSAWNGNQLTCFKCHQPGHKISDCPEAGGNNQITCFKCHQPGHRISDCPEAGGDNQITCFNCHQPGHRKADCSSGMENSDRKERNEKQLTCFHCHQPGHRKTECPNMTEDDVQRRNHNPVVFEENDMMTQYEGVWVLKSAVAYLDDRREQLVKEAVSEREDGNDSTELTKEEQIKVQRTMKKEKRRELKLLQKHLRGIKVDTTQARNRNDVTNTPSKMDVPNKSSSNNNEEDYQVVKFDGFFVKKESADRLNGLKARLTKEGVSGDQLQSILQRERRKEERLLKNASKSLCLKCRQPGHMVSTCPMLNDGSGSSGPIDICYTCGSTEHRHKECPQKDKGGAFSHATCFVCGETGHLAKECSENPRGLYPDGGACRMCGSVEHLRKDCPDLQEENQKSTITVGRMDGSALEALDSFENVNSTEKAAKGEVKVVRF